MHKILFFLMASISLSSLANVDDFPRDVICGKVNAYEFKNSKNSTIRTVKFLSANIYTYTTKSEKIKREASLQDELVVNSTVEGDLSYSIMINSITSISMAKALSQYLCIDLKTSNLYGGIQIVFTSKSDVEEVALKNIESSWK